MGTSLAEPSPAAGPMAPAPFRVARRTRETADTWTLALEPVGGPRLSLGPGQFTMLYAFGVGEVPISCSGDPTREGPLVHTVRAVGAVTRAICASRPGEHLGVRGPLGNCWPVGEAAGRDIVIVAGGIGLAPLRGALYHVLAHRREYGRVVLLYGGRTPADLLYRRELERWATRPDLEVDVTVDTATPAWRGKVGVVPGLVARAGFDADATTAFVVGPEVMMRFAAAALLDRGVEASDIYVSLERDMHCGIGLCGHCQLGETLVCRDGPVYSWADAARLTGVREL